jgi:tryptophan synthase alpha chain
VSARGKAPKVTVLLEHLEQRRRAGRKLLVPYVMAGMPTPESFASVLAAVAGTADAVEVGVPYSDPLMDGPVIASAGTRAIAAGVGPLEALRLSSGAADAPVIAMTYYNPVHRHGEQRFCRRASDAGVAGLIVPDLPLEESGGLRAAAAEQGLAWIPLVSPLSPPERVAAIATTATGFVYATSTLGVTGARDRLSERAAAVASACREATDLPVLVGIGISTPEQAREAAGSADGVVVGSAIVRLVLERGVEPAVELLGAMRAALNGGP